MSRIRTVVATEVLLVLGLLGFVALAYAVELVGGFSSSIRLSPLTAIGLSAVPALVWLSYFHAKDRHEPEPKHYVFGIFLLGAFISGPLAGFVLDDIMQVAEPTSLDRYSADRIVRAILVVGVAQELCKFIAVRYTVYLSHEFDEPMDGIIYMTAAGIGFATYENIDYFRQLDRHVLLATAAAHAVVTTLAHACFAGVLGYMLGRAKFSGAGPAWRATLLFAGLVAAALLNGLFELFGGGVVSAGMSANPWRGVAYAAGFAVLVFFGISLLMKNLLEMSPFRDDVAADEEPPADG
jgi:RsiW-degrading membrane proteinase PrsW (M82 family)